MFSIPHVRWFKLRLTFDMWDKNLVHFINNSRTVCMYGQESTFLAKQKDKRSTSNIFAVATMLSQGLSPGEGSDFCYKPAVWRKCTVSHRSNFTIAELGHWTTNIYCGLYLLFVRLLGSLSMCPTPYAHMYIVPLSSFHYGHSIFLVLS